MTYRGSPGDFPEGKDYEDRGCSVAPRCTQCPLPVCRFEVRGGLRAVYNLERDAEIARLYGRVRREEIAARFGISLRTVHRVMREYIEGRSVLRFIEDEPGAIQEARNGA